MKTYTTGAIERALPMALDHEYGYAYGLSQSREINEPTADLRKSHSDPSHANDIWAVVLDVRTAFQRALSSDEAEILRMWSDGWTQEEIADKFGTYKMDVSRTISAALRRMVDWLN